MGVYLNPGSAKFEESLASKIYVDKSGLISYMNSVLGTRQKYVCISRPRRFGKSMAADMLTAYYQRGIDTKELFENLKIGSDVTFAKHLNQYHVISVNIQDFLSRSSDIEEMEKRFEKAVLRDLLRVYPAVDYLDAADLVSVLLDIYNEERIQFIFVIDEWDCVFREYQNDKEMQKFYLDFLRILLKDKSYVALTYMTGILPIKKYGTHSALNMFTEFSMTAPRQLAEYVGFTEEEVRNLCREYNMSFEETKRWYDGYQFEKDVHIYSPKSVVEAMMSQFFGNYWTQTETYEALKIYIEMNFDGLRDTVTELLAGARVKINVEKFSNDMTTFRDKDDVLTLLIHLGYLAYDVVQEEVFIPNSEVSREFVNAVEGAGWTEVVDAVKASSELLNATWNQDEEAVARYLENAHMETSILTYHDENALSYTLALAYYSARIYYTVIRELPTGKGFADLVFLPRKNHPDKPALLVELKWDKTADSAINQIKRQKYASALEEYSGNLLLVGINYNKKDKRHECIIEKLKKG